MLNPPDHYRSILMNICSDEHLEKLVHFSATQTHKLSVSPSNKKRFAVMALFDGTVICCGTTTFDRCSVVVSPRIYTVFH